MKSWINKIRLRSGNDPYNDNDFEIGTTFDQVRYDNEHAYSLKDFFKTIQDFFKKQMHMHYTGGVAPAMPVMEWYQVIKATTSPTADENTAYNG